MKLLVTVLIIIFIVFLLFGIIASIIWGYRKKYHYRWSVLKEIGNDKGYYKMISKIQSFNYPTPYYSLEGKLLGYEESDEIYRKRIMDEIKNQGGVK